MAVVRIDHKRDYTVISNISMRDKRLSLKARGLLATMLSLPEEWDYTTTGLVTILSDGETSVRSALNELESSGYMTRKRVRGSNGRYSDIEYTVYEKPIEDNPKQDLPHVENPHVENVAQLNTNKSNKKELNKKEINTKEKELSELEQTIIEFEKMRKLIKAPLTAKAKELMLKKLDNLANDDNEKIEILNQSIENSWKGIFPLKKENTYSKENKNFNITKFDV